MAKTKPAAPPLELVAEMPRGGHCCTALVFSPDGRYLAAAAGDRRLHVYDVQAGTRLYERRDATGAISDLAFSPNGKLLASCGERKDGNRRAGGEVVLLDAAEGHVVGRAALAERDEDDATRLAFAPNGKHLFSSIVDFEDDASYLARIAVPSGKVAGKFPAAPYGCEFVVAPDGKTLAGRFDDRLVLWDVRARKERQTIKLKGRQTGLDFSPDGTSIAIAEPGGTVQLLSAATGKTVAALAEKSAAEKSPADVEQIKFSADGKRLATIGVTMHGDSQAPVRIWDLASRTVQIAFAGRHGVESPQGFPGSCAIADDFQYFANAGNRTRLFKIVA